jgi:hypothetical protein
MNEHLQHPLGAPDTEPRPGLLQAPPRALGLVLLPQRPLPLRGVAQQRRLLRALHRRELATLSVAAQQAPGRALRWLAGQPDLARLPLGLWGGGTRTRLALALAAQHPARVGAVVAINARLDAHDPVLGAVNAATLLLVLGHDDTLLATQQNIMKALRCDKRLEQVPLPAPAQPGDDGAVDAVIEIASAWLLRHLAGRRML